MHTDVIGVIGLGLMGKPMAKNLHTAGREIVVLNRSNQQVRTEFEALGVTVEANPAAVAVAADVVILMLPNTEAVHAVLFGTDGLATAIRSGSLVIDMGTSEAPATRELAKQLEAKGVGYVDAPVSGGEAGAINASLTIMAGGSDDNFGRAKPILDVLGSHVTHVGAIGAGQIAKAANQLIVGITVQAVAEALVLARHAGVDPAKVRQALTGGFADSPILQAHGQRMIDRTFAPGGKILTTAKDLRYGEALAKSVGVTLPELALARQLWADADANPELSELDQAAMIRAIDAAW